MYCSVLPARDIIAKLITQLLDRRVECALQSRVPRFGSIRDHRIGEPGIVMFVEQADQERLAAAGIAVFWSQNSCAHTQVVMQQDFIIAEHGSKDDTFELKQEDAVDGRCCAIRGENKVPD